MIRRKTQLDVARAVNSSEPTIRRLEGDGRNVAEDLYAAVAMELGARFDWGSGQVHLPSDVPSQAIERVLNSPRRGPRPTPRPLPAAIEPQPDSMLQIPEWEIDLRASAWAEVPCAQLDADDPEQRRMIETGRFRLRIVGSCMEPEYTSGQTVEFQIIRADQEPLVIGADYCVCRSDNTATFKRLVKVDEDFYTLAAINQREYPGVLVVAVQEVCRWAKVLHRLSPPPEPKLPKIKRP
jgi:hypothetical protein